MKIAIIAYFFSPDKRVGALRATYWHKIFDQDPRFEVTVFTGTKKCDLPNVHYVPITKKSFLGKLMSDVGADWLKPLKQYFKSEIDDSYDVVIITGSPFMHFGISSWLRKRGHYRVILDYRDPFAINPGFNNSRIKQKIKGFFERSFNKRADGLVTVNNYCAKIISQFDEKPSAIVQNGYDETIEVQTKLPDLTNPSFSYTGKFYFGPEPIIDALEKEGLKLIYAGQDSSYFEGASGSSAAVENMGLVDYQQAVQLVADTDVSIIQTYGKDFQSTTKIFDYIRCERPILIVSGLDIRKGSIHDELKGYPNVFWAKNDVDSIRKALKEIRNHDYIKPDPEFAKRFSRKYQMQHLISLIEKVGNEG